MSAKLFLLVPNPALDIPISQSEALFSHSVEDGLKRFTEATLLNSINSCSPFCTDKLGCIENNDELPPTSIEFFFSHLLVTQTEINKTIKQTKLPQFNTQTHHYKKNEDSKQTQIAEEVNDYLRVHLIVAPNAGSSSTENTTVQEMPTYECLSLSLSQQI